jgi:hypothetical protein
MKASRPSSNKRLTRQEAESKQSQQATQSMDRGTNTAVHAFSMGGISIPVAPTKDEKLLDGAYCTLLRFHATAFGLDRPTCE